MVGNVKAFELGDILLALLDLCIKKFFDLAAVKTHQVVMVLAFVEFKNRFAAFKVAAREKPGLLELGQHPVHRRQTHIRSVFQKDPKHVFGGHVPLRTFLENFQNLQARQSGFEARAFELIDVGHACPAVAVRQAMAERPTATMIDHIATKKPMSGPMFDFLRHSVRLGLCMGLASGLVGCSSFDSLSGTVAGVVTPYRADIVQGNVVTKEQADLLKPGMPRAQVRDIMGTPLLASVFHADRWDYVFTFKRQGVPYQARKVSIYFKGDAMERMEADPLPTEAEFVSTLDSGRFKVKGKPRELQASEEDLRKFSVSRKTEPAPALPPLPASYPPLEPAAGR